MFSSSSLSRRPQGIMTREPNDRDISSRDVPYELRLESCLTLKRVKLSLMTLSFITLSFITTSLMTLSLSEANAQERIEDTGSTTGRASHAVKKSQGASQGVSAPGEAFNVSLTPETAPRIAPDVSSALTPSALPAERAPPKQQITLSELKRNREAVSFAERARSLLGLFFLLSLCWLMSNNRAHVPWRVISWGLSLQFALGWIVMKTSVGASFFSVMNGAFTKLLQFSNEGSKMIFGNLALMNNVPVGSGGAFGPVSDTGQVAHVGAYLAFSVLPTIIFFSSLMAILYHLGVMEWIVKWMAWVMQKTMRTSGSETLSASGNIFIGQTEAPLLVRPYLKQMTESELMAVMTGGFATVAGGVMAAYIGMLSQWFPDIAGHLLSASVMSAPAALICAKLIVPEPDPTRSATYGGIKIKLERVDVNLIDAAARGAADGLKLALNVGGMLLAFVGLVYLCNYLLAIPSYLQHVAVLSDLRVSVMDAVSVNPQAFLRDAPGCFSADVAWESASACTLEIERWINASSAPMLKSVESVKATLWSVISAQEVLGIILQPLAWLMGVSWDQARSVGQLFGVKTILNEFVAYGDLGGMLARGEVSGRSAVIAVYALCGFANFSSIAIQIGGIGGIAPERKADLARLGLRAMFGGTIAAMMTATVAGILY